MKEELKHNPTQTEPTINIYHLKSIRPSGGCFFFRFQFLRHLKKVFRFFSAPVHLTFTLFPYNENKLSERRNCLCKITIVLLSLPTYKQNKISLGENTVHPPKLCVMKKRASEKAPMMIHIWKFSFKKANAYRRI